MKHLVNITDLSLNQLNDIINLAEKISENPQKYSHLMNGKILATLFFEPSTRTRLSFESAMTRLRWSSYWF